MVLQRYISHLILSYAARYIKNLETTVNLWSGDMVFHNLDVRLDVLQHSLGIPPAFSLSKGFIKELRVHIPWASITTSPIEITLTGLEAVLTFNPHAPPATSSLPSPPATPRTQPPPPSTPPSSSGGGGEEEGGGWASDLITKIIANLTLHVRDLSFKYLEGDVCACVRLHALSLHSTDPSWRSTDFMDLLGPWKLIHKALTVTHLSFYLYPDDSSTAPVKNERVCILQQLSISCRIKSYLAALGANADVTSWSTNTVATASPSAASGVAPSPNPRAVPRPLPPPCGPAITVDVHVTDSVDLSLSSYQFERLHSLIQSKSDFYATSAAAARVAQSIAAVPAVIAQQDQQNQQNKGKRRSGQSRSAKDASTTSLDSHSSTDARNADAKVGKDVTAGANGSTQVAKGWMSWMWEFVAAEEEEDEELLQAVKERDERAEFQRTMGHLAPTEEIVFCFHLTTIALHIRSDHADGDSEDADAALPSVTELTSDSLMPGKPGTPSPPRSYALDPASLSSSIAALESSLSLASSLTSKSIAVSTSWSSASAFASLHIRELGMILSQPLLLSKPALTTRKGDAPASPSTPPPSSPAAVKPPTFAVNVVSVSLSVIDSPSTSSRAVLTFGPEFGALTSTPGGHKAVSAEGGVHRTHVSKVKGRQSPFTAASCLHRSKYWERVADAGEQQHLLYALSIYHTVKQAMAVGELDDESLSSPWAACFDVLLGPLAVSVDWSSSGTERLIHQILVFLKTMQTVSAEEEHSSVAVQASRPTSPSPPPPPFAAAASTGALCWLQLKCAVPSCGGYILGNPCPGHGVDGSTKCRKTVVVNPCRHYTAHAEVACLPY